MELSYISGNGAFWPFIFLISQEVTFLAQKIKKLFIFRETKLSNHKLKKLLILLFKHKRKRKKFLILFLIKKQYFLVMIIKWFFSFYIILFYTQPVCFFHLLRDFCNVHNHIVAFFLFLL